MLGSLPGVMTVDEPLLGLYLGPFLSDTPGFRPAELGTNDFTLRRLQAEERDQFFSERYVRSWLPRLRTLIDARLARQMADLDHVRLRDARVVIKEPNGSQSADLLMRAQPSATLIFLLRDGREVVDSELAANAPGAWVSRRFPGATGIGEEDRMDFIEQAAHKWSWRTSVVQAAFEAHPGPRCLVRYEDLRTDPRCELHRVATTMGLTATTGELDRIIADTAADRVDADLRGPGGFVRDAPTGSWRERLSIQEQSVLGAVLDDQLRTLGYITS